MKHGNFAFKLSIALTGAALLSACGGGGGDKGGVVAQVILFRSQ